MTPTDTPAATDAEAVVEALGWFINDERFQVAVGGNPNVVDRMIAEAKRRYESAGTPDGLREAFDVLSGLSSYLGAGMGDDGTTAEQFDKRIRWGVQHIVNATILRCAGIIEEQSKGYARNTWGTAKRAILDLLDATLTEPPSEVVPEALLIELDEAMALNEQSMADCQAEFAKEKYRRANAAIEQAIGVLRAIHTGYTPGDV